jgi:uncharacterized protein (TIGR02594 family)
MAKLPPNLQWLAKETAPRLLVTARALYGTRETKGGQHNPVIMGWAKELGGVIEAAYTADEIPWCALFMSWCCHKAGLDYPKGYDGLRAKSFATWGNEVLGDAMLGDVLVFERPGGGHVGLYVGEDTEGYYHVWGGNQDDMVGVIRLKKKRCIAVRRTPWKIAQPPNVRRIMLAPSGAVSTNEA